MKISVLSMLLMICSAAAAAQPVLLFSDLTSGPKAGNSDNSLGQIAGQDGAIVTLWGKNIGTDAKVYCNGAEGRIYYSGNAAPPYSPANLYDTHKMQMIIFQVSHNASDGAGKIYVESAGIRSNELDFFVNEGKIYFVNSGASSTGTGTFADPWKSPASFISKTGGVNPGDILYFRGGDYSGTYGESGMGANFCLTAGEAGTENWHVGWIGYPGETARITGQDYSFRLTGYTSGKASYTTISKLELYGKDLSVATGGEWNKDDSGANNIRFVGNKCHASYSGNTMTGIIHIVSHDVWVIGNAVTSEAVTVYNNNHAVYIECGSDNVFIGHNSFVDLNMGWVIQAHSDSECRNPRTAWENIHIFSNLIQHRDNTKCRGIGIADTQAGSYGYIYNNVLYNIGGGWGAVYIYSGNFSVIGNTFYGINSDPADSAVCVATGAYTFSPKAIWKNNILKPIGSQTNYFMSSDGASIGVIDSNCYANGYGSTLDGHGVATDPKLVSPAEGDFHLSADSPVINKGAQLALGVDFDGTPRPQGVAWDIGAYEYLPGACTAIHQADSDPCDGCIRTNELLAYINLWRMSSIELSELMRAIGLWKGGCS